MYFHTTPWSDGYSLRQTFAIFRQLLRRQGFPSMQFIFFCFNLNVLQFIRAPRYYVVVTCRINLRHFKTSLETVCWRVRAATAARLFAYIWIILFWIPLRYLPRGRVKFSCTFNIFWSICIDKYIQWSYVFHIILYASHLHESSCYKIHCRDLQSGMFPQIPLTQQFEACRKCFNFDIYLVIWKSLQFY